MFSCLLVPVIKHGIQAICPVFSRKESFRFFESLNRIFPGKTLPQSSSCGWQDGRRAICVALQCEMPHVQDLADSNLFSKSYSSIRRTSAVLRDTMNSPWGTNTVLRYAMNFLRETNAVLRETNAVLRDTMNSPWGTNTVLRDTMNSPWGTNTDLRDKINFLWEKNTVLRDTMNSPWGTNTVLNS